jgi:hypothetical protein
MYKQRNRLSSLQRLLNALSFAASRSNTTRLCPHKTRLPHYSILQGGYPVLTSEDGQQVVTEGIGNVLAPVGIWALACDVALNGEGKHRNHREATILDFLHLELLEHLRVLRELQRVEGATRVQTVHAVEDASFELANAWGEAGRASSSAAVVLDCSHKSNLSSDDSDERERVGENNPRDSKVVERATWTHDPT